MANELNIQLDPFSDSGLTLIAKGFNPDGTQIGSNITMTEVGSRAYYTASFSLTSVSDGAYLISFETATDFYGQGVLYVKDGNELDLSDVETETLASARETNIISEINANENKIDLIETKAQADSRQTILVGEHNDTQADIAALNDFNPATDTVANVTLVATTTTNTDMRGTDGANTIAPDNAGITQIQTDISSLNDITASDVYAEFTSGTNEDAFKADVSGLASQSSIDTIDSVVDSISLQTTRVDGLIENSSGDRFTVKALEAAPTDEISEAEFHNALDSYTNKNDYKADVSLLATEANATTNRNSIITEVNANEVKIDTIDDNVNSVLVDTSTTIPSLINALNDLSEAQVKSQADQALTDYDAPTKAELDSVENAILNAVSGLNNLTQQEVAEAVWNYLQSSTTVSASMKEAILKTLVNANLIPAAI